MNKNEAHQILDKVKNGIWQPQEQITIALILTGDIRSTSNPLRKDGDVSCYVRSRTLYGETAYERAFGDVQEFGRRRKSED